MCTRRVPCVLWWHYIALAPFEGKELAHNASGAIRSRVEFLTWSVGHDLWLYDPSTSAIGNMSEYWQRWTLSAESL